MSAKASSEVDATEHVSAPAVQEAPRRKTGQKPGWMSIPGGPKEPDRNAFHAKMRELNDKKRKLFEELQELQVKIRGDGSGEALNAERTALRDRLTDLEKERRTQRDARSSKNDEIAKLQKQRNEIKNRQKELSNELGGFESIQDIDEAINYIMLKMETSGGGLSSEKKTVKRIQQLEEAKNLLLQLQPLNEALGSFEEKEYNLHQEYREIHERIGELSKEVDQSNAERRKVNEKVVDKRPLIERCDQLREQIRTINEELDQIRSAHTQGEEAWSNWRIEAQAKFAAKIKAEREERLKQYLERRNAVQIAAKKERALKRMNPYENEISVCGTLVLYLRDKKMMSQRDAEERKRREAAATFDPTTTAPEGFAVLGGGKWDNPHTASTKKGKKDQGKAQPKKQNTASASNAEKDRVLQHSEEKQRQFQLVGVEPPMSLSAIDAAIEAIAAKRKEYESHVKTGEPDLSSDDENDNENGEEEDAAAAETE